MHEIMASLSSLFRKISTDWNSSALNRSIIARAPIFTNFLFWIVLWDYYRESWYWTCRHSIPLHVYLFTSCVLGQTSLRVSSVTFITGPTGLWGNLPRDKSTTFSPFHLWMYSSHYPSSRLQTQLKINTITPPFREKIPQLSLCLVHSASAVF